MRLPIHASRIFETPLLIDPRKAAAIMNAAGGHFIKGKFSVEGAEAIQHVAFASGRPSMGVIGDRLGRAFDRAGVSPLDVVDGVAIIGIEGTLVHKGKFIGMDSGETSYEGLMAQISRARLDPNVRGVVFEVDSYGGEVSGCADCAAMIFELSKEKPTLSILTDCAYSAGYYLASQARQIVMPADGGIGSIGAIWMHVDLSKQIADEGIKVTILQAGKHKSDGNMFEALPKPVADKITGQLQEIRERFAAAVALGRGDRFSVEDAMRTEADDWQGDIAVEMGLADAVMRPSEAFDLFVEEVNRPARVIVPGAKGANMATDKGIAAVRTAAAASAVEDAAPQPSAPAVDAVTKTEHETKVVEATSSAKSAERERIKGITTCEESKGRTKLAEHFAHNTDMTVEAAKAALAAAPVEAKSEPDPVATAMGKINNPKVGADADTAEGEDDLTKVSAVTQMFLASRSPSAARN